jgi:hypothetical protein
MNVKNVGLYNEIFKLISTTMLQRNTKVGNSGFVPPVKKKNIEKTVDCKQKKKKMVGESFFAQNVKYMCIHEQHGRRGFQL